MCTNVVVSLNISAWSDAIANDMEKLLRNNGVAAVYLKYHHADGAARAIARIDEHGKCFWITPRLRCGEEKGPLFWDDGVYSYIHPRNSVKKGFN